MDPEPQLLRLRMTRLVGFVIGAGALFSREVFLLEDPAMVQFVSGDEISDSAGADLILVCDAAALPGCFVQIAQQRECGASDGDVVLDHVGERALGERAVADVVVLLEAFDRRPVTAGDAQGAIGKDALGIADVSENFFDSPLVGRVAVVAVGFVTPGKEQHHLAAL